MFQPESVLPFSVAEGSARDRIRAWYGKLWLAPGALKRRALTDTVRGVYLPYWTFDAHVDATGPRRPATTTTRPRPTSRTARRARARCARSAGSPRRGTSRTSFDDDLVCASVGVHPRLVRGIEPFPTQALEALRRGLRRRLGGRALPDRPRRRRAARARRHGQRSCGSCARRRSRATRIATCRSTRTTRRRRSSTSSRRCGCCRTRSARSSFQCVINGVIGRDPRRISEEPVEDRVAGARGDRRRRSSSRRSPAAR